MRMKTALLAATLLMGTPALSMAQTQPAYDPDQLPATHGTVAQYSLTPRGDVDGLIFSDGTEVHLPPHLGTQLVFAVKPGNAVHGLKARAVPMIQAMSVTNDASGATVIDNGPGGPKGPRAPGQMLTAQGPVKAQLHGPQGELNGVLLQDGTIIRLPPPEAQRLANTLQPGSTIFVQGDGYAGPLGRVIAAQGIGPNAKQLTHVSAPPPHPPGPHPLAMAGEPFAPPGGPGAAPPRPPGGPGTTPPSPSGPVAASPSAPSR